MTTLITLSVVILILLAATVVLALRLRSVRSERDVATTEHKAIVARYRPILDAEAERQQILQEAANKKADARLEAVQIRANAIADRDKMLADAVTERSSVLAEISQLRASAQHETTTFAALQSHVAALRAELALLDEEANLESFGFYRPHYNFAESKRFEAELEIIRAQQKEMLKAKTAAICPVEWTVGGSRAEGKKATNQTLKLMLRAFNGESDAAIAKVRYNNIKVMEARINKAFEVINSLAEVNQCRIVPEYLALKLKELYLAHEYEEKVQAEKEEQRRIREQIRDEEIAQRQLDKARQDAEREEARYQEALEKARRDVAETEGAKQGKLLTKIEELERRLAEAHAQKERAIAQAQLTRSGHVYVVSNIGSFGEHVYKIGMTRRLDPLERIRELGDASVPFQFDIHAVIYSDDAPALEAELHREFNIRRVNRVNERKEFFRVTIDEIVTAVQKRRGDIEVTRLAAAEEYRKTQALVMEEQRTSAALPIATRPGGAIATA